MVHFPCLIFGHNYVVSKDSRTVIIDKDGITTIETYVVYELTCTRCPTSQTINRPSV
jgi:hypothetical protein